MIRKIYQILSSQLGLDAVLLWRFLRGIPQYLKDYRHFRKVYQGSIHFYPCLHDRYAEGGTTKSEYFWQDLLVARWIHEAQPQHHVDVGSRIDGFIAHVASFREIEVFDVRPVTTNVPGVLFRQVDLADSEAIISQFCNLGYCDSLSCLHALEHFGLGRYGDKIDPWSYVQGIKTMSRMLKFNGKLYLSTPIGQERVEFNAHRVFDPKTIVLTAESENLKLSKLTVVTQQGIVREVSPTQESLIKLSKELYNLGIFVFVKDNSIK